MLKAEKGLIYLNYLYTCQAPYFPEGADNWELKQARLKCNNKNLTEKVIAENLSDRADNHR